MRLSARLLCKVGDLTKQYSNLPESYIKRSMEQVYYRYPKGIQYFKKEVKRRKYHFSEHRPWTAEFKEENAPRKQMKKVFLEPIREWKIFKGDRVEILTGDDKGKQGIWKVLNCQLKKIGWSKGFPGIMIKSEKPLLVTSEVKLVDPSDLNLKLYEFEWRFTESGEKVRVSLRTGRIIPMPHAAQETYDYKTKSTYKESVKDTKDEEVTEITYKPSHKNI
ncbi:hypothetical protein L9F63_028295 [Diploptera punctata]|uniref:Large ribosomal subunit protein uL24 C-terminal domain-containing protein n=1 Tax=Diploptera punctata TaxID=6984 RepID=A0AAD7ZUW9_DIPPU|nr:hypothetical protein L9F63_028295 [Diploptera punctata]